MSNVNSSNDFTIEDTYQHLKINETPHQSIQSTFNYYSTSSMTSLDEIFYSNSETTGLSIVPQQNNMLDMFLSTSSNLKTNNNYNIKYSTPLMATNSSIIKNGNIEGKNCNEEIELECFKRHTIYDEKFLNKIDSAEILKLELSLKMIPENIEFYFNSLKHDVLQLTNSCMYTNTHMNSIIKNIHNTMKLTSADIKTNKINYSTIPFVSIDMNALHSFNDKLDHVYITIDKLLGDGHITKKFSNSADALSLTKTNVNNNDFISKSNTDDSVYYDDFITNKSHSEIISSIFNDSINKLNSTNSYDNDGHIGETNISNTNHFINNINSYDDDDDDNNDIREKKKFNTISFINNENSCDNDHHIGERHISNTISFINNKNSYDDDDDDDIRQTNIPNTISPINNTNISIESSQDKSLINHSLQYELELKNNETSEILIPDISLSNNELSIADNSYDDIHISNNTNKKRYWLRHRPKSTDHFFSPFNPTLVKRKSSRIKTNYNDVIVYGGRGHRKVIIQYKVHSVLKANSSELINKLCPENKKCKYDNANTTLTDISNLIPKKNDKPCRCGIFPSQVPSTWKNSLHISIHKNLHKLQFKSKSTINVVKKINDNGFLYDIIKINTNCDEDEILKLTLKNIQDFINLEINYPKTNNNLNHSIFLAINPENKIIGYLEIDLIKNACIYQNNRLSENVITVKFGVSKLWVMVMFRNNGVAKNLLKQFCTEENVKTNDIAFAYHGNHGISFIKNYFANNSVLIYSNTHFSP